MPKAKRDATYPAQAAGPRGAPLVGQRARSELEYVHRVEEGLAPAAIDHLMEVTGLSENEMDRVIPRRTRNRQRKRGRLSTEQSDRIARAADVYALAFHVFGDREKAKDWMREPNVSLGGDAPLDLLRTASGAGLVENILLRIAHGVYT
jgi:putative toxin-antitoxin system antitoxin component (TIGR02293 family)